MQTVPPAAYASEAEKEGQLWPQNHRVGQSWGEGMKLDYPRESQLQEEKAFPPAGCRGPWRGQSRCVTRL